MKKYRVFYYIFENKKTLKTSEIVKMSSKDYGELLDDGMLAPYFYRLNSHICNIESLKGREYLNNSICYLEEVE